MCDSYDYFCQDDCDLDGEQINAALADGTFERWRIDGEGRQWLRRRNHPATIFAVPQDDSAGLLARIGRWLRR
ncbi:MAG: hypothetical protein FJ143_04620 [Deltaproteobacteria bacterium]|nr:hypothetical protein [Deltaproteobacteria bacterium]